MIEIQGLGEYWSKFVVFSQKFCDDTTIHGFKELFHARSYFFKFFWLVMILGGSYMTFCQSYQVIRQFQDEPTTTVIKKFDGIPRYPPMLICYPHWIYWVDIEKVIQFGINRETFLYGMSFLRISYSNKYFDVSKAKEDFFKFLKEKNFANLTSFYLAIVRESPMGFSFTGEINFKVQFNEWFSTELCYSFVAALDEPFVTQTDGQIVLDMHFTNVFENEFRHFVTDEELGIYFYDSFLYEADDVVVSAEDLNDGNSSENETVFGIQPMLYVDGTDNQLIPDSTYFEYFIKIKADTYQWKSSKQKPCSYSKRTYMTSAAKYCRRACETSLLVKHAGAEKLFVDDVTSDNQTVSFKSENHGMKFLGEPDNKSSSPFDLVVQLSSELGQEMLLCKSNCLLPCEQWIYDKTILTNLRPVRMRRSLQPSQTRINVQYPSKEKIFLVVEVPTQTWESIIANVGGLLGLWLGASIISFIQVFYFCFSSVCVSACSGLVKKRRFKNIIAKKRKHRNSVAAMWMPSTSRASWQVDSCT